MAPIKIERIVSVSSEDEAHPAKNLLMIDYSNKKWKCKTPGEKQISIVLQLAQFCRIVTIYVGNEHSAFIEVLVGKSCSSNDDFEVLLVSSSLMTLQEAKCGTNVNGVSFFKEDSLCHPVCENKWDRIKIVCTQPFNKHIQYGLSFIVFHTVSSQNVNNPQFGNFQLKAQVSVEPLLKAGGLFANRNKFSNDSALTGAAAIRAASASIDETTDFLDSSAHKNDSGNAAKTPIISKDKEKKKKPNTPNNDVKAKKNKNIVNGTTSSSHNNSRGNSAGSSSPKKKVVRARVQPFTKKETRPFGNLMTGVVFSLSGYENPLRSELRNKALAMGARYEANWNCNCTHLICAFRNTPKYHQVRGIGKIVKKDWIEDCCSRRMRLPWRRYALDPNDTSQAESEEEIYEEVKKSEPPKRRASRESSEDGGDTDDEIEKVRQKQKKLNGNFFAGNNPSTSGISNNFARSSHTETNADVESDSSSYTREKSLNIIADKALSIVSDSNEHDTQIKTDTTNFDFDKDTESEDENSWVKRNDEEQKSLPPLPVFFQNATIALLDDLSPADRKLLTRYIKAHNGSVANDDTDLNTVLYAITEDSSAIVRIREDYPQVIGVTPEWIWRSHDEGKLLPASSFKVL